jgi:type II secretory pathway component PulF
VLYSYNKKFRTVIDRFLLGIGFIKDITISKLAHNLSFQLNEGLTLVSSLKATSNTLNNIILKEHLNRISEEVSTGKKFSDSVKKADIFPELFVAAVATGEKSGNLAEFLEEDRVGKGPDGKRDAGHGEDKNSSHKDGPI